MEKTPLRQAREQREMTISEVARAVETDPGNLSRVERREQRASPELAQRLARFFGYSVSEIQILYPERFAEAASADELARDD